MGENAIDVQLPELVARLLDQGLSAEEHRLFAEMLRRDDACRAAYYDQVLMHTLLVWHECRPPAEASGLAPGPGPGGAAAEPAVPAPGSGGGWATAPSSTVGASRGAVRPLSGRSPLARLAFRSATLAGVAAVLALLALQPWRGAPNQQDDRETADAPADRAQAPAAAHVARVRNAKWEGPWRSVRRGDGLSAGTTIELASGEVEVRFLCGARVVLQAPARFVVESPDRGRLLLGKLSAIVPESARGFLVLTPTARIVDRGTEFGVAVDARQTSVIRVFAGRVDVEYGEPGGGSQRAVSLLSGAGLKIDRLAGAMRPSEDEARLLPVSHFDQAVDQLPVEENLVVWLAADGEMQLDPDRRVRRWYNRAQPAGRTPADAEQLVPWRRPRWTADGMGGRPALTFDGQDDSLRLARPSELGLIDSDYEVFVAAQSTASETQFALAGGVESFEIHINFEPHQVGARFIPRAPFRLEEAIDLGVPGGFSDGRPHVFAARVDAALNCVGVLEVDGAWRASARFDARSRDDTLLRIGRRSDGGFAWNGQIAELLMYSAALAPADRHRIVHYLAMKYGIPLAE